MVEGREYSVIKYSKKFRERGNHSLGHHQKLLKVPGQRDGHDVSKDLSKLGSLSK